MAKKIDKKKKDETQVLTDKQAQEIQEKLDKQQHDTAMTKLMDGLPTSIDALWVEAVHAAERTAEAFLSTGRVLLALKEQLGHGEFTAGLEERGFDSYEAAKSMQAYRKFPAFLKSAKLNKTKLIALLPLSDEAIDLEDQKIMNMTFDAVDKMTVQALRKEIRKHTENEKKGKEQLEAVEKENRDLRTQAQQTLFHDKDIQAKADKFTQTMCGELFTSFGNLNLGKLSPHATRQIHYSLVQAQRAIHEFHMTLMTDNEYMETFSSEFPEPEEITSFIEQAEKYLKVSYVPIVDEFGQSKDY